MAFPTFIITIVNTKTKEVKGFWVAHPEEIDEYEMRLEEDEAMYVNELDLSKAIRMEHY